MFTWMMTLFPHLAVLKLFQERQPNGRGEQVSGKPTVFPMEVGSEGLGTNSQLFINIVCLLKFMHILYSSQ